MKKYLVGLVFLTTTSAFAVGNGSTPSYDMYSPRAGSSDFKIGVTLRSSETTSGATTDKGSGYGLGLEYARSLMGQMAFYINQDVYGYKVDSTTSGVTTSNDYKTLSPTEIGIKSLHFFGNPYFYYSLGYQLALLEKRDESGGLNVASYTDLRDNLHVAAGFGVPFGMFSAGAKVNYYLFQDSDYVTVNNVTLKNKSGSGMDYRVFGQFDLGSKFGFAYSEQTIDSFDTTVSGVTSSNLKTELKAIQFYGIIGFGNTDLMFDISKLNLKDESAFSKYDYYLATVSAKMSF